MKNNRTETSILVEYLRRDFESDLATVIIAEPASVMPAVSAISEAIVNLIARNLVLAAKQHNQKRYQGLLDSTYEIVKFLYDGHSFARLGNPDDIPKNKYKAVKKILLLLRDDSTELPLIMNIHYLFFHHVYNDLVIKIPITESRNNAKEKGSMIQKLMVYFSDHFATTSTLRAKFRKHLRLYRADDRGRLVRNTPKQRVNYLGIREQQKECATLRAESHARSLGYFEIDIDSDYTPTIIDTGIPFVAGPSGHTNKLLRTALALGHFDKELMQQYLLATASLLIGGGHHSAHEMLVIARKLGLKYKTGCYECLLPNSFKQTEAFTELVSTYPLLVNSSRSDLQILRDGLMHILKGASGKSARQIVQFIKLLNHEKSGNRYKVESG